MVAVIVVVGMVVGLSVSTLFSQVLRAQYGESYQSNVQAVTAALQTDLGGGLFLQPSVKVRGLPIALKTLRDGFHVRIRLYRMTPHTMTLVADSGPEPALSDSRLAVDAFAPVRTYLSPTANGPRLGMVLVSDPQNDRARVEQSFVQTMTWIIVGASLLATVVVSALADRLTAPLRVLTRATARLDVGHFSEHVPEAQRDEVGDLARQFNRMSTRLKDSFASIADERDHLAAERDRLAVDRDRLREFVAEVSHELRTPLTALHTFNDLLQNGAGHDPATRQEFLAESAQQIERLTWLTHNLLDLSRLDAGMARLTLQPADVAETTWRAIQATRPAATAKGITLAYERGPVVVPHDPPRLEQAVSNAANNAVKFGPPGSTVRIGVYTSTAHAIVEIHDDGPGIPADDLPCIFDRFYRGRQANRAGDGSGLGLAITKAIVEAHGATIAVESGPGRGTTMRLMLPLLPQ